MKEPRCRQCDDSGWVETQIDGVSTAQRCQCAIERLEERRRRRLNAGIPRKFRGVALERNPIASLPEAQRKALKRYHDRLDQHLDEGQGLWIAGESGIGKSVAAAILVMRAMRLGRSTLFCDVPELLNELRRSYREGAEIDESMLYRDVGEVDMLVLDDLGAPKLNDWVLEQLFIFINGRYKDEKAVVITTDLSKQELQKAIGRRTVRRLEEVCGPPLSLRAAASTGAPVELRSQTRAA